MENKKLVNILLKDMGELEELIAEIKGKGKFDSLEIEFLHTRAKGIMQLLQMLNGHENETLVPEAVQKIVEEIPEKIIEPESENSSGEEINIQEDVDREQIVQVGVQQETESGEHEQPGGENINEESEVAKEDEVQEEIIESEKDLENGEKDDLELEDEDEPESNQRLGDSFLKGKSVNDIIHDNNKLEFKLSNRPVTSIRSSIGINDRFQYIRELFDGSPEKFTATVISLDEMNSINEAVVYLQQNFKWKKNETSLKFVNLVKRRFTNE